ncbi:MAG: 30S ribosomal protein S9 [Ignavibacteriae bacterium]|nr:30S ribosomal protein S9 [Ignavibacteriota bacterium]MCB0724640.1 30S ribosomal protein S9 [Ignavibacteriota bacterium]MCB9242347.1 30S ribosomal protein S9 [Ignavibacteriales bacterium]
MATNYTSAVGRRKTATARVLLTPGSGKLEINGKEAKDFLKNDGLYDDMLVPFRVTDTLGSFDAKIIVNGGGATGQVGAIKLGISRALVKSNEELKPALKKEDLMTRDPRMVERKKYGRPKARKRFQFSKR